MTELEHRPHRDLHKDRPFAPNRPWFCCAAVQLGVTYPDECVVCGEAYPCTAALAAGVGRG